MTATLRHREQSEAILTRGLQLRLSLGCFAVARNDDRGCGPSRSFRRVTATLSYREQSDESRLGMPQSCKINRFESSVRTNRGL